jgi:hypothetical protein
MKKRGQMPDARTFTIIFRGCAKSQHPTLAVSESVRLYHALLNDKRIKPNTIHMNAVLEVCARAGDIESMFSIVNTGNDPSRTPSSWTYTILINALRARAEFPGLRDTTDSQKEANVKEMMQRCRAIWQDVITEWKKGKTVLDEPLVCAMGRAMLLGDREEQLEILSLLEQTMSIPRLDDSDSLVGKEQGSRGEVLDENMKDIAHAGPSKVVPNKCIVYAVPGRNTLSLVLRVAADTRRVKLGLKYWNLFVQHYGVVPDSDNWHQMLRVLRRGKSSGNTADLLAIMPDEFKQTKTFRIAFSTCIKDNINPNVMTNADRILDFMNTAMKIPDATALRTYLDVALLSHYHMRQQAKAGDVAASQRAFGKQLVAAVDKLEGPLRKCIKTTSFPELDKESVSKLSGAGYNEQREAIALARKMIGALDKVVTEKMLDEAELGRLKTRRNAINRYVTSFFEMREQLEPKLRKGDGKTKAHSVGEPREMEGDSDGSNGAGERMSWAPSDLTFVKEYARA